MELGPWFHNLHLPDGTQTAPQHPLGDFPAFKWHQIRPFLPADLEGWSVLDVGCNAGFYSFELARLGARVVGIDMDPRYLAQARWAARILDLESRVRFEQMQVYDLAHIEEKVDLVWFMGVFYHLRYPLLALDILSRLTRQLMVFQTLTMPGDEEIEPPANLELSQRDTLSSKGWPVLAFIEHELAGDPTNWWAPNHSCVQAMLRSCGMRVAGRPAHELYLCEPQQVVSDFQIELIDSQLRSATGR